MNGCPKSGQTECPAHEEQAEEGVWTVALSYEGYWIWLCCSLREHNVMISLHSDSGVY